MTVQAYVLFKVSSGSERDICKKIVEFDGVEEANVIFGEYDLISKIRAENLNELVELIEKIGAIPSIVLTSPMIIARAYRGKMERNIKPKEV